MTDASRPEDSIDASNVVVDYDHPHGRLVGVPLSEILSTPAEGARKILSISNPRTSAGDSLNLKSLKQRTMRGGDLEDPRINWSHDKP